MKILAIDTSCDDTSVAISENLNILSNVFWSKMKLHSDWGGVVPHEAKRQHDEFLDPAIKKALSDASVILARSESKPLTLKEIDYFAVTYGPGLAVALESGIKKAKELAIKYNKPLIAVDHMVGHIYANLAHDENSIPLSNLKDFEFPLLALTISGGHTDLVLMDNHLNFSIVGTKIDDAIGECIDKVGRILGFGFPAGKEVDEAASKGNSKAFKLPVPMANSDDLNFSYSGLKTAVLYKVRDFAKDAQNTEFDQKIKIIDYSKYLSEQNINDFAASFLHAAFEEVKIKVKLAIEKHNPKMLVVGGGVIASKNLRIILESVCKSYNMPLYYPVPFWLCTDNAAMIAIAANFYIKNNFNIYTGDNINLIDRVPNLKIGINKKQ